MKVNNEKEETKITKSEIDIQYSNYEYLCSNIYFDDATIKLKLKEINALINHVDNRIHYTESRITRTVTFAVTLIGVGIALFAASITLKSISLYLGLITTLLFILTGSVTALIHVLQINPKYPFRALPNDWKWFYPRIVDEKYKPSVCVKENDEQYLEKRLSHVKGLINYAEKIIGEDLKERLKVDIQQLYLLHVNEKYKNDFLTTLRKSLTWGLSVTLIFMIVFFSSIVIEKVSHTTDKPKAKIENINIEKMEISGITIKNSK